MKTWPDDHPKARLMTRKRAAILDAAAEELLGRGYEGASMGRIAAGAGVSIMTLYRHAETKDDLFQAVVARACDPADDAERARYEALLREPLREALVAIALMVQDRLASPATTRLLRTVMLEGARRPSLGTMAYRAFVTVHEERLDAFLADRVECRGQDGAERRARATAFMDRLVGADLIRLLLGLEGASEIEWRARAAAAADEVVREIDARS